MNSKLDLTKILLNKWREKKLSHFYLLNPGRGLSESEAKQNLNRWTQDLILETLRLSKGITIEEKNRELNLGHPDFLILEPQPDKRNYVTEDFEEFFKFLEMKHFELPWKFVLIQDAHLLTKIILNKLLKSLEEPPVNTTIFLLNPLEKSFLQTIESRAIKLCPFIGNQDSPGPLSLSSNNDFNLWVHENLKTLEKVVLKKNLLKLFGDNYTLSKVLDKIRYDKELQDDLFALYLRWETEQKSSYLTKEQALNSLRWYQVSKTFNNSSQERFFQLLVQDNDK